MIVVWVRRDARLFDNVCMRDAFQKASDTNENLIVLYIYSPSEISSPTFTEAHLKFINEGLIDMDESLRAIGGYLVYRVGTPESVFKSLQQQHDISQVFMHDDTESAGVRASIRSVMQWAASHYITVRMVRQDGVMTRSSENWLHEWNTFMESDCAEVRQVSASLFLSETDVQAEAWRSGDDFPNLYRHSPRCTPAGGEKKALEFIQEHVPRQEKSGMEERFWSILSIYISWGHVSLRTVYQKLYDICVVSVRDGSISFYQGAAFHESIRTRLVEWSQCCQRFHNSPVIEFQGVNHSDLPDARSKVVTPSQKQQWLKLWMSARAGFPDADEAMRELASSGWVDSRMQFSLVSVAYCVLQLDWHCIVLVIARLSLAHAPGVFYCQLQKLCELSVNDGIKFIATKNIHQNLGCEKEIRDFTPELSTAPMEHLATPRRVPMVTQEQQRCVVGVDYPAPIVDISFEGGARPSSKGGKETLQHRAHELECLSSERNGLLKGDCRSIAADMIERGRDILEALISHEREHHETPVDVHGKEIESGLKGCWIGTAESMTPKETDIQNDLILQDHKHHKSPVIVDGKDIEINLECRCKSAAEDLGEKILISLPEYDRESQEPFRVVKCNKITRGSGDDCKGTIVGSVKTGKKHLVQLHNQTETIAENDVQRVAAYKVSKPTMKKKRSVHRSNDHYQHRTQTKPKRQRNNNKLFEARCPTVYKGKTIYQSVITDHFSKNA